MIATADPAMDMLFDKAAGQGFVVLLLLAAVIIIGRMLQGTLKDRVTDLKDRIVALVRNHLFHYDEWSDQAVRRWIRRGNRTSCGMGRSRSGT